MNILRRSYRLFWIGMLLSATITVKAQGDIDKMFLVLIDISDPQQIPLSYTTKFDKKQVRIDFAFEDTINYLSDFVYEEEPMYGPNCFVPDMKLVFKNYTYIVSMYCTSAMKFKNSAPYKTSSVRMKNDLVFTKSVYSYLNRLRKNHFGATNNKELISKVVSTEPLETMNEDVDDINLLLDEDDEEDETDLDEFAPKDDADASDLKKQLDDFDDD